MSLHRPALSAGAAAAAGFTLIELIVAMVLAGIVLAIAVPSLQPIIQQNRVATQTNAFVGDLSFARSAAVTRGIRVTMCKSADGAQCTTAGGWAQGWIVFVDANDNAAVDSGETVLRVHDPLKGGATLTGPNYLSYVGSGFAENIDQTFVNDTFTLTIAGAKPKDIIVNMIGRVRTDPP